jgi:hypothetical protein
MDIRERLKLQAKEITKWKEDGEKLFSNGGVGLAFRMGAWWGQRPFK